MCISYRLSIVHERIDRGFETTFEDCTRRANAYMSERCWVVMGIGMGSAIAAVVETGHPVLAVEGDRRAILKPRKTTIS